MAGLEGKRVLDYGCGYGDITYMISKTNPVVGIDIDPERVSFARTQYPELEFRDFAGDVAPFPAGSFDVVLSCVVLWFVPNHASYLRDVRRLLTDRGTLTMVTGNAPVVRNFIRRIGGRPPIRLEPSALLPHQVPSLLSRLGFAIDAADYFYDPPFVDCRSPKDFVIGAVEQVCSLARVASAAHYVGFRAHACERKSSIHGD